MNGNNHNKNLMCNQDQILKSLPLKKRRAYLIDPLLSTDEQDENYSKIIKQSCSQNDSLQIHIPISPVVQTPPSSPHLELLRQQYAYLSGNSTTIPQQNHLHPSIYNFFMAQQQQQCGYTIIEDKQKGTDLTIDEHFRKSLGDNYNRCLTPDDSSSSSSSIERTAVDSIEEHFARSLAKFWPLNNNTLSNEDETSSIHRQITESVVDDHFAKALGSTTWEKLKEKS